MKIKTNKHLKNAILTERSKHLLAKRGDMEEFMRAYNKRVEIYNSNTGPMWDSLNLQSNIHPNLFPMAWDRTKIVSNWISKHKPTQVLNIGCGPGNLEKSLLQNRNQFEWTGIDISKKSIENLKSMFPSAKFITKNALSIKSFNKKFDVIVALEVLEHISPKNTFELLQQVYDRINPRGYFICSVPINEGLENLLENGKNPNGHVRIYTKPVLLAELQISEFKIIKTRELYAFHTHYKFKKFLEKFMRFNYPNNIIAICQKP